MKLLVIGHSCLHPRQSAMLKHLAIGLGHDVHVIGPQKWNDEAWTPETIQDSAGGLYEAHPLPVVGQGIFGFSFVGWDQLADAIRPDVVYLQQEPWSVLAKEAAAYCPSRKVPLVLFSWEDKFLMGQENRTIEQTVLRSCAGIVAGNSGAAERMERVAGHNLRTLISPQTGVDTSRFHPMPEVQREYEVIFHGRLVREKGIQFTEQACQDLGLKLLIVGGRGNYQPRHYAKLIPWATYAELLFILNSAKVSATCSWSYKGYSEQWPSSVGDALASGLAAVRTDNGSMNEHYGSSPAICAKQGDQESITTAIKQAVEAPPNGGREWVEKYMSAQAIASKLDGFLKEVLDG